MFFVKHKFKKTSYFQLRENYRDGKKVKTKVFAKLSQEEFSKLLKNLFANKSISEELEQLIDIKAEQRRNIGILYCLDHLTKQYKLEKIITEQFDSVLITIYAKFLNTSIDNFIQEHAIEDFFDKEQLDFIAAKNYLQKNIKKITAAFLKLNPTEERRFKELNSVRFLEKKGDLFITAITELFTDNLTQSWKTLDIGVQEGLRSLGGLCKIKITVGSLIQEVIPSPSENCKKLLEQIGVDLEKGK